ALTPTLKTEERLAFLDFSFDPIFRLNIALFASRNAAPVTTENLSILDGKRIGRLIGIATEERIDAYIKGGTATLVKHMTFRSLLDNLTRGRVDFVVGDRVMVEHAITELGAEDDVVRLTPDLGQVLGYLAFAKNRKTSGEKERKIRECVLQLDLLE
ncbi:MAG: transporter substrate-binding domain-containing protein, partial [Kordiimonadaceae bacterium]|nr:transporter substrate-binding domain-containing protein [Kordiimonadaceae bacterium]